jgi:hypothetical protein
MHPLRASRSNTHQTILLWNCCAQLLLPRLILTPLTRTRDLSTILTGPLLRLITCHILARTHTIPAFQSHPFQRAPCHTIPHPLPHPRRLRLLETTKPHPLLAAMSPTSLPRRLLGSSRAGTSLLVATELLASSPILRVRIIQVPCPRLPSIQLLMSSHPTLPTFIPSLRRRLSFNRRMVYRLPTTCPPSPHSQQRSQSHHHHPRRSS